MHIQTTLPITEARKTLFSIAENVQSGDHYTLTERGKPKVVVLSAEHYDKLSLHLEELAQNNLSLKLKRILERMESVFSGEWQKSFSHARQKGFVLRDASSAKYTVDYSWTNQRGSEELIKAQLYVELIEKYRYPVSSIELGRYVRIGDASSKRYVEADVIVDDERGNITLLFSVSTKKFYEENTERAIRELFDVADALSREGQRTYYLIHYTRDCQDGFEQDRSMVIDHSSYRSFAEWEKANRPVSKRIPYFKIGC